MNDNGFLADTNAIINILEGKNYMLPFLFDINKTSI